MSIIKSIHGHYLRKVKLTLIVRKKEEEEEEEEKNGVTDVLMWK